MTNKKLIEMCKIDWLGDNVYDLNKYKFQRVVYSNVKSSAPSKEYLQARKMKRPTHWEEDYSLGSYITEYAVGHLAY